MQPKTETESSPSVREEKREHRTTARTFASDANGGEVGDEGVESLEDLELFVDRCEMQSSIVWMMATGQDLREGEKAMSLPRTLGQRGMPRVLRGFGDWLESMRRVRDTVSLNRKVPRTTRPRDKSE
jgi:hypothetical protein